MKILESMALATTPTIMLSKDKDDDNRGDIKPVMADDSDVFLLFENKIKLIASLLLSEVY